MRKYILCFLFSVSGHFAAAGDFEQGLQSYQQKNYSQAKKIWQPLAKDGDVRAQYNLALILFNHEKNNSADSQLQRQTANSYLTMSRENGLVDSYFFKAPQVNEAKQPVKADNTSSAEINPLDWLNQQQKTDYTLQLSSGKNRSSMVVTQEKLLDSQLLEQPENLFIRKLTRNEQQQVITTYVLIYGIFKSRQQAQNAAEKLPKSILKSSPWIRQFTALQSKVIKNPEKN